LSLVKKASGINEREAFHTARKLLLKECMFSGSSTGVLVNTALQYAKEVQGGKKIVTFACDTGNKYLSKMYSDEWMSEKGFLDNK
jgi:cystathionine beta-synthase